MKILIAILLLSVSAPAQVSIDLAAISIRNATR